MIIAQKQCAEAKDYAGAKELKPLIADQMKRHRAVCFHLPWFQQGDLPGDARFERPLLWPVDLAFELDILARQICLIG